MKKQHVPAAVRRRIREQAQYRCGYYLRSEELAGERMTFEHIQPERHGGSTKEKNLWLSCRRCNEYKGTQAAAVDPVTGKRVQLFNPRSQNWEDHFSWGETGVEIKGITPVGRATVHALRLNNPEIIVARRLWVAAGWWPPEE